VQAVDIDMDRCAGSVPVLRAAGVLGPPFLDLHPLRLSILAWAVSMSPSTESFVCYPNSRIIKRKTA
jgi:hypothetical protein